jgi:hypothetical protein
MKRHRRYLAEHHEVVTAQYGTKVDLHMAVYSPQWRAKRLPIPAPRPLPPEEQDLIKRAAEGRL